MTQENVFAANGDTFIMHLSILIYFWWKRHTEQRNLIQAITVYSHCCNTMKSRYHYNNIIHAVFHHVIIIDLNSCTNNIISLHLSQ